MIINKNVVTGSMGNLWWIVLVSFWCW